MSSTTALEHAEHEVRARKASSPRRRERWMVPREHGGYAWFAFPLLTVLFSGEPTLAAWLLTLAAGAFFLAHEPTLVLVGSFGPRAERERGPAAKRMLLVAGLAALAFGAAALYLAPLHVQYAAMVPLVFGLTAFLLAGEGLRKTAAGQTIIIVALSTTALPVGLACGLSLVASLSVVAVWVLVGLLGSAVVRLTKERTTAHSPEDVKHARHHAWLMGALALLMIAGAFVAPGTNRLSLWVLAAALPTVIVAAVIVVARPKANRLRTIGWALAAADVCTWIGVVTVIRTLDAVREAGSTVTFPYF
jgi:hypothetical protein